MLPVLNTKTALVDCLNKIGAESKIDFREFVVEDHTNGKYRAGVWTYRVNGSRVALEYWFSRFSSKREEFEFNPDADAGFVEKQVRTAFETVRTAVGRKRGWF